MIFLFVSRAVPRENDEDSAVDGVTISSRAVSREIDEDSAVEAPSSYDAAVSACETGCGDQPLRKTRRVAARMRLARFFPEGTGVATRFGLVCLGGTSQKRSECHQLICGGRFLRERGRVATRSGLVYVEVSLSS